MSHGLPLCKIRRKPGFVPGTNPLCPGDKPGLSRGHSRGVPRATGPKSLCLCAFFLPEYGPENMIVKAATPDMVLNPLCDPNTAPTVPPSGPPSDQSDPWLVPKSTNFPKNIVVQKGVVFGISYNDAWRGLELHGEWPYTP